MIAALVITLVFAALMFLVLALDANLSMRRARGSFAHDRFRFRRDRAVTVAAFIASIALVIALVGAFL